MILDMVISGALMGVFIFTMLATAFLLLMAGAFILGVLKLVFGFENKPPDNGPYGSNTSPHFHEDHHNGF